MSDEETRSLQHLQESQDPPPHHFVKSLFGSQSEYDPFGDSISVVQEPPQPEIAAVTEPIAPLAPSSEPEGNSGGPMTE
jgi:hypothetical protein